MPTRLTSPVNAFRDSFSREERDTNTSEAIRSIQGVELLDGKLLKSQEITSSSVRIPHGLGREYRGFIPVKPLGRHPIYIDDTASVDRTKFIPLRLADEADLTHIYGEATIDSSGDPTRVHTSGASDGVYTITKSATGTYTVTLGRGALTSGPGPGTYDYFRYGEISLLGNTTDDVRGQVAVETVASDGVVKIFTLTGATKTNPAATSVLLFHFVVEKAVTVKSDLWVF